MWDTRDCPVDDPCVPPFVLYRGTDLHTPVRVHVQCIIWVWIIVNVCCARSFAIAQPQTVQIQSLLYGNHGGVHSSGILHFFGDNYISDVQNYPLYIIGVCC